MSIHDYPQDHLMSHIRRVIYLKEKTNRTKLLNFFTDETLLQCFPLNMTEKETKWACSGIDDIKNLQECGGTIDDNIFNLIVAMNMYSMKGSKNQENRFIKCNKFFSGEGWETDGFTIGNLENNELNLKRYEIIKAFDDDKIVTFKGNMIHRLNENCRIVDTEFENGKCLWKMLPDYEEFMIYDPTSPEVIHRVRVILEAFEQGKRVRVNGFEVLPVKGFSGAFHWQCPTCRQYRPLEKIVYKDFPIEVF